MPPAASVDFTSVMLFVHVLAVIVAFGVTFAYPVLVPFVRRTNPRMLPTLFAAQYEIGRKLIVPGQIVVLVTGFYLSGKLKVNDEVWVIVPLLALLTGMAMSFFLFLPTTRALSASAKADIDAAPADGPPQMSQETMALAGRMQVAGPVASALIVLALFFMTVKP